MLRRSTVVVLCALLAACSSGGDPTTTEAPLDGSVGAGAAGPSEAVVLALRASASADYEAAAVVTWLDQMPIVALLEGVPPEEAAGLDLTGRLQVASRFWEGFGAGVDWPDDPGRIVATGVRPLPVAKPFSQVSVVVPGSDPAPLVAVDDDGWRVDVIASFGPALIGEISQTAQSLAADPSEEARALFDLLVAQRPSLLALRSRTDLGPSVVTAVDEVLGLLG